MFNLESFAKLLLIIGGIVWGIYGVLHINIVKYVLPYTIFQRVLYIVVGLAALLLMFNRNFYLPFLGKTILPLSLVKDNKTPDNSTFSVKVHAKPNSRVIYWAAEPHTTDQNNKRNVQVAYGEFKNSGITTADSNGIAILHLRKPDNYTVNKHLISKMLHAHVHYRYSLSDGLLSEIFTKKIHNVKKDMSDETKETFFDTNNSNLDTNNSNVDTNNSNGDTNNSKIENYEIDFVKGEYKELEKDIDVLLTDRNIKNCTINNVYENDTNMFDTLYSSV